MTDVLSALALLQYGIHILLTVKTKQDEILEQAKKETFIAVL